MKPLSDRILAAYAAGTGSALELLDAERTLLEVRLALARARTERAIAVATLEGTVAAPILSERS